MALLGCVPFRRKFLRKAKSEIDSRLRDINIGPVLCFNIEK